MLYITLHERHTCADISPPSPPLPQAKTIETVEGGGLVVILLNNMQSLQQLYTLSMV
jgi:hypothetical protein